MAPIARSTRTPARAPAHVVALTLALAVAGAGSSLAAVTSCGSSDETSAFGGAQGPNGPGGGPGSFGPGAVGEGDAGPSSAGDAACVGTSQTGELAPADLVLVVDKSYSTDFPDVGSKWLAIRSALRSFVGDPSFEGLGVGLQYLPLPLTCEVASYAKPAVEVGVLPAVAPAILASLDEQRPSGGTPMAPAMKGALTYAQARATADPRRKVVLVLATDGIPDDQCRGFPNTIENVVTIVTAGAAGPTKIPTFVIAVGKELTPLRAIAQAGGTGEAIVVDTAGDVQAQFLAALQSVRKLAIGCEYTIPPAPPGSNLDYGKVNVRFTANGAAELLGYARDPAGCGANPRGWFYDDANAPTKVVLCPTLCTEALAASNSKVDVELGCTTILR